MANNGRKGSREKGQTSSIKTWDEVDQALRRMGEIDIATQKILGNLTLKVNGLKATAEEDAGPLNAERKEIEESVAAFCEEHKDEFARQRSKELTFGLIAYRIVTKIVIRSKEACLAAMHALKLDSYIRIIEEPDKLAMEGLDDAVLAKVGAKRKTEDKLRIEPNLERLKEAA